MQHSALYTYQRLITYLKPLKWVFACAIIGNLLFASVDSGFTYLLKPLMNKGFVARDVVFIHRLPFIIIGLFVLRGVANFLSNYCMTKVGRSVVMQIRQQIFRHLLHLPVSAYDQSSSGELLATIIYNVEQVANASTDALTTFVQSGCYVLGLFVVMISISWRLSLLILILLPIIAAIVKLSSRTIRRFNTDVQQAMAHVTHIAEEVTEGHKVVRLFAGEHYETEKFAAATETNRAREIKVAIAASLSTSTVQIIAAFALAATIYIVTIPHSLTTLTAGSFTSFITAMVLILKPMKDLTQINATIQRGIAAAASIFKFLDQPIEHNPGRYKIDRVQGDLQFQHLYFSYNEKTVLENIDFMIPAGKKIALIGKSGSGKSTLVNLLPRFYELQQGRILLDHKDIREYDLQNLRSQFAIVSQQVTLFNDTIANNIAYGSNANATEKEIIAAAERAYAMEFIRDLPQGLNTLIGENGVLLSGGQRQRLAIARAILKNAPILILDEATSALDNESERHIQAALEALMQNRTSIIIAHRLSTIELADLIIVLSQGKIIEIGSHSELLEKRGYYARARQMDFSDH